MCIAFDIMGKDSPFVGNEMYQCTLSLCKVDVRWDKKALGTLGTNEKNQRAMS